MADMGGVYDKDDKETLDRSGLRSAEENRQNNLHSSGYMKSLSGMGGLKSGNSGGKPGGGETRPESGGFFKSASLLGSSDKGNDDKQAIGDATSTATRAASNLASSINPLSKVSVGSKVGHILRPTKRKGLAGGIIASILVLIIFGFSAVTEFELVTFEKVIERAESKIEHRFEKKEGEKVAKQLACRLLKKGCPSDDDPEDSPEAADAAETDIANGTADPLEVAESKVDFTNPAFEQEMSGQGIEVDTDKSGAFDGFTDSSGANVTNEIGQDGSELSNALDNLEINAGEVTTLDPLVVSHAGAVLDPLPEDTSADDVDKTIIDDITEGSNDTGLATPSAEEKNPDNSNAKPTAVDNPTNATDIAGTTESALSATESAIQSGASETQALADGEAAFNTGSPLLASTVASDLCSVKKVADTASNSRVPTITNLLIRHGTLLFSLADELKSGKLTSGVINKVMQLFNGDPSAAKTLSDGSPNEAAMPGTQSAAWQRDIGNPVNTDSTKSDYTPDIDPSSLPTADAGTAVVNEVDSVTSDLPLGNATCTAENSIFGGLINSFAGIAQVFGDGFTFGGLQAGIVGLNVAVTSVLKTVIVPAILKYFTPVGLYGLEHAVQWVNNADAGSNLMYNDDARRLGGEPLSHSQAGAIVGLANIQQQKYDDSLSWADRTFALSNPDSLVSRLALDLPTSRLQLFDNVGSFIMSVPRSLENDFALILTPQKLFAQSNDQDPGEPYGITQYGYTNSELNYDPLQNEQFLYNTHVSYGTGSPQSLISLLGNPNSYLTSTNDPSSTDVLHCFLDGYDNPEGSDDDGDGSANWSSPDPICGTEGSYDYNNLPPQPINDTNVAISFCAQLDNESADDALADSGCLSSIASQIKGDDIMEHFRQYILDVDIVNNYVSLTDNN